MKPPYLIVYDYETTSAKPATTRGVQFAAIGASVSQGIAKATPLPLFNEITDPEVEINHEAALIHGITPEMIQGKRLDKVVAKDFAEHILAMQSSYDVILAGHNSTTFDFPILKRLSGHNLTDFCHLDTLTIATRTLSTAPNHKLSCTDPKLGQGLVQYLKLDDGAGAHDAMADILMVWKLIAHFSAGLNMSVPELSSYCAAPRVLQICHLGKHKGKPWKEVPFWYVKWMTENWEGASPDMQATIAFHFNMKFRNP